jgi:hypothetical protein
VAERALKLRKAWSITALLAGYVPTDAEATIPAYRSWPRKRLDPHIADLETALSEAAGAIVVRPASLSNPGAWTGWQVTSIRGRSRAVASTPCAASWEFEQQLGSLPAQDVLDIPPYAEILLQVGSEVAFPHPEYMLARDLVCLLQLYSDAEALLERVEVADPPRWAGRASENAQGLARITILTCFNLLESVVSGLARAYSMQNAELDESSQEKLLSSKDALRKRMLAVHRVPSPPSRRRLARRPASAPGAGHHCGRCP